MERILNILENIIGKHVKKIAFTLIFLFLLGIAAVIYLEDVIPASKKPEDLLINSSLKDKIPLQDKISQKIILEDGMLEKIEIPVVYGEAQKESSIEVILRKGKTEIQRWEMEFYDPENTVQQLNLDEPLKIKEKETYTLDFVNVGNYIEGSGYLGKAKWNIPETSVRIDGDKQDYDIAMSASGGNCSYLIPLFWAVFTILLILYAVVWYAAVYKKWKIQKLFVIIGGTIGILYTVLWAPYACPDEYVHIATAYYDASTLMGDKAVNNEGKTLVREGDMTITPNELVTRRYTYNQMRRHWNDREENRENMISMDWKPMKEVPAVSYFPQILAILAARAFGLGNVTWLILGRLFALFAYLAAGYFALKYMPFAKMPMAVLMLGPTAIQEAASFSYDSMLNTCSFLFVAYTLFLAYRKKKVSWKDWIVLFVSIIILAPVKIIYLLLGFLILLIPGFKISKRKIWSYLLKAALILSSVLVSLFSRATTTSAMAEDTMMVNGQIVEGYTIKMLITDPLHTAALWMNTLKDRSVYYLKQIFGGYEAYSKVEISWLVITGFFILVVLALIVREKEKIIDFKGRLLGIFISIGIFCGTLLAFNLAKDCTNLTSDCVYGVQGRYFLPFLPLLFIAVQNRAIVLKKSIKGFVITGVFCLQFLTVWGIFETIIGR